MSESETPFICTTILCPAAPIVPWNVGPAEPDTPSITAICGHKIWLHERVKIGETPVGNVVGPKYGLWEKIFKKTSSGCTLCEHKKILEGSTACATCGTFISKGSLVGIAHVQNPSETLPFAAHSARTFDGAYVICPRCVPGTAFISGYWESDQIKSPFRTGTVMGDMMKGYIVSASLETGPNGVFLRVQYNEDRA